MVPPWPTVTQVVPPGQTIRYRSLLVPEDTLCQLLPASELARIVPLAPTARQLVLSTQSLDQRSLLVPEEMLLHCALAD